MNYELKSALLRSGVAQYEIAQRAGLSETALSRIVRGRRAATCEERQRLAVALGLPESALFEALPDLLDHGSDAVGRSAT